MRPLPWMKAVRDHPQRPPSAQRDVLFCLALRLDWKTGEGFASTGQLAADADVDERTVRRATGWARKAAMLVQKRRGHRTGDGGTLASEWRLTMPQPDTGDLLSETSTGQSADLNRTEDAPQPDTATPPSGTSSSRTSSSARGADATASRPPATPENLAPRRVPPCPECGKPFAPEDIADDAHYAAAMRGDLVHAECDRPSRGLAGAR